MAQRRDDLKLNASGISVSLGGDRSPALNLPPIDVVTARSMTCCRSRVFPGSFELDYHAETTIEDGKNISLEADARAPR